MIQVDISNIWGAISLPDLLAVEKEVAQAHAMLAGGAEGSWMALPAPEETDELRRILDAADKIRSDSDVCVVLGIGSGCLGARAAVELLQGQNRNLTQKPQLFFAGNSLSTRHWTELMTLLEGKDFSVMVISPSGDMLEPAIAFRNLRWMLERRYGTDEASNRIYVVTDPETGALGRMAREEQWQLFALGHRPSVLSGAGLLPMAVAGIDILEVLGGAANAAAEYDLRSFENPVWLYAGVRNALYRQGKTIELLESFEPGFRAFGLWWQRLFSRAEGKGGRGIFPATAQLTQDLYSLGQLVQEGRQDLFETMIRFLPLDAPMVIGSDWKNWDGLNYLEGKQLDFVEEMAFQAAASAHADIGVPVLVMDCGILDARTVGELFYFLELSSMVSAYTMGVDPFGQPGVDVWQRNLGTLLGKPDEA